MARRKQKVEIDGLEKLMKTLSGLNSAIREEILVATKEEAEAVLKTAKELAPYKTGHLRESLDYKEEKTKEGKKVYQVYGKARYVMAQEYGVPSRNIPAHPFLRPALQKNKKFIKEHTIEAINRAIDKVR